MIRLIPRYSVWQMVGLSVWGKENLSGVSGMARQWGMLTLCGAAPGAGKPVVTLEPSDLPTFQRF